MFGFIGFMIFGLIVGLLAKVLLPGRDPGGIFVTLLLGMVGAILGGWLGRAAGFYAAGQPAGFLMAVLGAILILLAYRVFNRKGVGAA